MRRLDDRLLYSASDLAAFLGCRHRTVLDLVDLDTPLERAGDDPMHELLQAKGDEHEAAYVAALRESGHSVVPISTEGTLDARVAATEEAIHAGADVVYQAALLDAPWHGYADFLVRVERPSAVGAWSYEVVDTKLARTPAPTHLLQITLYAELLAAAQGAAPHAMHLVLGDGTRAHYRCADFAHYVRTVRARFEALCAAPPDDSYPVPCPACPRCPWRERCRAQWERDDHLSLVADIRRDQTAKLEAAGITTVARLARLGARRTVAKLAPQTLARLRHQARLQREERRTGAPRVESLPPEPGRGFALLPDPAPGDLFLDLEGDPLVPDGLEYLFGLAWRERGTPRYRAFWAHDAGAERRAFEQTVDLVAARFARHPRAHLYHYGHYEKTALERLSTRHATREAIVDDWLREGRLVDLHRVVRGAIRTSRPGYSLKDLEALYAEQRTEEVTTAGESVVAYERWRQGGDDALLEEIRRYNETDCRSTEGLRDWLVALRPPGARHHRDASAAPAAEKSERVAAQEAEFADVAARLVDGAPAAEVALRETVRDLLEFHRREAKPQWWAMFDRRTRTTEELLDDPECLAGLTIAGEPEPDKRSWVFTYRLPEQDTKLALGARPRVAETLEPAGEIVALDEDERTLSLRRGQARGLLPEALSLVPGGPIDTTEQRGALYRVAGAVIANDGRYRAVRDLLLRSPPRVKRRKPGRALVRDDTRLLAEASRVVAALDESCLFIQGPPGAGKTYTASHLVADLIAKGRRVGITSNSHKAINHLLAAIEARARERGLRLHGMKKSDPARPETHFGGTFVEDVFANEDVDPGADLIAGTAWLFSREELDRTLDVLFVDEAGQVALANAVAMATCARNLVLVGDQMQLGQPIQGAHPGRSKLSVLEHLLEDEATIAPERGIFLPTTWRMHPDVCTFVSDAVYDGRLHPEDANARQRLVLPKGAHPALAPTGIRFVPIEHAGCSQRSDVEAELVRALYADLLGARHVDRDGRRRRMTARDVLVVAPYNVQVNNLKRVLPAGARVGTVDKFQGQEAEAVLVSMTTSGPEDLPRHVEFLYSRNRLNVALSRARALAVVVASPRLLEIDCRTVDQMRLVNTLCWVAEYAR